MVSCLTASALEILDPRSFLCREAECPYVRGFGSSVGEAG